MSRRRIIDPSFWEDETVATWPLVSRLTYIALWNHSDDYGFVRAAPSYLHSRCFPYDNNIDMKAALEPLVASNRLLLYQVNGESYGHLSSFLKWQTINRPSKGGNPKIEEGSRIPHGDLTEDMLFQQQPPVLSPSIFTGGWTPPAVTKTHDRPMLTEGYVNAQPALTPEVKVKLKQPLPTVEVVNAPAREEQPQPNQIIENGVMQSLEKQWEPGSGAEKVVEGWWKYYNHLGQQENAWHTRAFETHRDQLLRVLNTGVSNKDMRLAITYLYRHTRRRYMPNGDDLYRHPTTLFGRIDEPFSKLQNRIDTLMMEAVIWEDSQRPATPPPEPVDAAELKRHQQLAEGWLDWIITNPVEAAAMASASAHEGASLGAKQKRLKDWTAELERIANKGGNLDLCLHSHITQGVDDGLRKEIENGERPGVIRKIKVSEGESEETEQQQVNATADSTRV